MRKVKFYINTLYIDIRRFFTLLIFTPISVLLHCWWSLFVGIPARQTFLNLGSQFLKSGAGVKIGDPHAKRTNGKTAFVKNLYYNFAQNKITASYTEKPQKATNES